MWQVTDTLFLGDRDDARDAPLLDRQGVTHVVNCAAEVPCHFPSRYAYLHLAMEDPDPRFGTLAAHACRFIERAVGSGGPPEAPAGRGRVLVHCSAGVSRSAAVVLAYLCHGGRGLQDAARYLAGRVLTNPDPVFLRHLIESQGVADPAADVERLSLVLLGRA